MGKKTAASRPPRSICKQRLLSPTGDWFKQALSAPVGTTVISKTLISPVVQETSIVVARTLRNENCKVFAIAIVDRA